MKSAKSNPFRFHSPIIAAISVAFVSHVATPSAHAASATYYWDNNGSTAGFGTAAGTWAAPTTGSATQGWSTSSTGAVVPGSITTDATDAVNFGTATALAAGTITVSGTVAVGNITYGSGSGAIVLSGGTINLAATETITVNNSSANTVNSLFTGAGTSLTKEGTGTLIIANDNVASFGAGSTFNLNAGTVRISSNVGSGANNLGGSGGFAVNLGNTSGTSTATLALGNTFSLANPITVRTGSSGTKTLTNSGNPNVGNFSGAITANDNLTVSWTGTANGLTVSGTGKTIADTKTVTFSATGTTGTLTDSAAWGGLGKIAYGGNNGSSISISGAKTYSGGATLNAMSGTGAIAVAANSTPTSGTVTSGPFGTGALSINATRVRASTSADFTVGNAITLGGNPTFPTVASEKSLILTGPVDLGAASRTLTVDVGTTVPGKVVDFQGIISSATATSGLTKAGAGVLTLSGANTYSGNTTVTAGTLNITGTLNGDPLTSSLLLGTAAANTVVNVSNDMNLFTISGANITGSSTVYNQTAGTVITSPSSTTNFVARVGYGYFNLTGGTYKQNSNRFSVTDIGAATGVAYVGGTGILDLATTSSMIIGYTGTGVLTVGPGGSVNRNGGANQLWLTTNTGSTGTINMAGGTMDTGTVTAAAIRVGNGNAGPQTGFINLAKGTLTMGQSIVSQVTGTGTNLYANYAGGTLKASAALSTVVPATSAAITVTSTLFGPIDNPGATDDFIGGLTMDTNGFAVTQSSPLLGVTGSGIKQANMTITPGSGYIGAPLVTFTGGTGPRAAGYAVISGGAVTGIVITSPGDYTVDPTGVTLTGGGGTGASVALTALTANPTDSGLTKINSGALTLTGANTYAGATTINGGTLTLSGSGAVNSSSGITINGSGAKLLQTSSAAITPTVTLTQGILTGSGTVNSVNVGAGTGGVVSNNDGVAGAPLTIGTLTFNGAATVNTQSSSTSATIVTTALSSNAAGNVTINPTAAFWADGATYDLVSYGGSIGGAGFGQFTLGTVSGLSARQSASALINSGTAIQLTISGDTPYWTGDGDAKWNLSSTNNWKLVSNNNPALFLATDNALFNDNATGAGPISVDIDLANVAPTSTTFNSSKDYVLNSTGGFGISTGFLTKSGTGKLTINNANTYAGGTTVNGGTLVLGNANAIGTGTLTLGGGNLDSSVADLVNAGNNVQAWNSDFTFVGTENLDLGSGAVTMSANRTVTVSAKTLTVGGAVGGGAVGITKLGAGTLNLKGTNTFTGAVAVNAGTLALSPASTLTMANTFTGTATLNINPGNNNLQLTGDLSGFSGIINVAPPFASPGKLVTGNLSPLGIGTIINIGSGGTWFTNNATQTGITLNLSGAGNAEGFGALRSDTGTIDSTSSVILQANSSIGGLTTTNTGTINAVISENVGPFSLTKVGTNNIALGGANTYSGLTTVSAGALILRNSGALGTTAAGTTVANTARVELDNITVTGEAITIIGNGTNFFGALQGRSGTSLWTGNVTVDAVDSRIGAAAGASLEVSGVIDDGPNDYRVLYRIADAAATVILSGANTYTGGTFIVGTGPVAASSLNNVVGGSASSSLGAPVTEANGMILFGTGATGGIMRYVGAGETTDRTIQIGANSAAPVVGDTGSATIESNATATALTFNAPTFNTQTNATSGVGAVRTLTLGGTNTNANTISGIIQNNLVTAPATGSAAVSLTKAGAGTWTLAGDNTYTGSTTVSEGTLNLTGNRSAVMGGIVDVLGAGSVLNISGNLPMGSQQLRVGSGTSTTGTINQTAGAVTWANGSQLTLGTLSTCQGIYNLSGGSFTTASQSNRGVIVGTNANCIGIFNLSGTGALNMVSGSSLQIPRGENVAATGATGTFNQTGGTATVSELRVGGNTAVNNANQTGTLNLSAGIFSATSFTSLSGGDASTSTINISGTADVTLPAFPTTRGTGASATINFDGGTLKPLAASLTYMGGLTNAFIKAGGAKINTTNGSITITQSLLTDPVSTGGGLIKEGSNTLTLTGTNTYTGATAVNTGTLALVAGSQTSPITVTNGASLDFTLGSGTTSTSTLTFVAGSTVKITGTPAPATSYTLFTTTATISGTPVLDAPIAGYQLQVDGGNTLKLIPTPAGGYASWKTANSTSQTIDLDHDSDGVKNGVEYFMLGAVNTTGFNALPGVVNTAGVLSVTWPKAASYTGTYGTDFVVETSDSLTGTWSTEIVSPNPGFTVTTSSTEVKFTFPSPLGTKNFVRLKVTGP